MLQEINSATWAVKQANSVYEKVGGIVEGPSFISDEYGLPREQPGKPQPDGIIKRRKFLQSLSSADRNTILTGDPAFSFDPVTYDVCLRYSDSLPRILRQNFGYLIPQPQAQQQQPQAQLPAQQPPPAPPLPANRGQVFQRNLKKILSFRRKEAASSDSDSSSPASHTPSPCVTPPIKRQGRPPADITKGVTGSLAYMQVSPPAGAYALRSSTSLSTASPGTSTATPKAGWHKAYHQVKKEVLKAVDTLPGASVGRKEAQAIKYEWELKQVARAHVVQLHREQVNIKRQMLEQEQKSPRTPQTEPPIRKNR